MRDNRIKEVRFSKTFDTTTNGSYVSDSAINGEILEVAWSYSIDSGSASLKIGETGEEFWRRNNPSGATYQVTRPRVYVNDSTGNLPTGSPVASYVINDVVWLGVGSAVSGANPLNVYVRYK